MGMQNMPSSSRNLKDHFGQLSDPRFGPAKRHELLDILMIAVCAMLCGAESFTEMAQCGRCKADWFKTWLALPHGIPSHDTFNRVFGLIDPTKFMDCFLAWTQSLREVVTGSWSRWMARRCGAVGRAATGRSTWSTSGQHATAWCWDN